MSQHTPGPWMVDGTKAFGAYGVWTDYAHPKNPGHDGAGYGVQICSFQIMPPCPFIGQVEKDANARLIAAAPELLAACKAARAFGSQGETHEGFSVSEMLRAAIAKAEGRK